MLANIHQLNKVGTQILLINRIIFLGIAFSYSGSVFSDRLECPCKVVKITDGDTVHVLDQTKERHKIRLSGIDAPENKQAFGNESRKNLAGYIAGKYVDVEYNKRDRYGRIVGKLIKNGQDINLQQIKDGFAWHYKYYQKEQSQQDQVLYSSAEIEARNNHLGLWSEPAVPPWEFRQKR